MLWVITNWTKKNFNNIIKCDIWWNFLFFIKYFDFFVVFIEFIYVGIACYKKDFKNAVLKKKSFIYVEFWNHI